MSDTLKKFVSEHRQDFDTNEPGKELWEKIDAQLAVKEASKMSSKWLSKFKYLGFGASVLVVAIYFIAKHLNNSAAKEQAYHNKVQTLSLSEQYVKAFQNIQSSKAGENNTKQEINDLTANKNTAHTGSYKDPVPASHDNITQAIASTHFRLTNRKKDSVLNITSGRSKSFETSFSQEEKIKAESSVSALQGDAVKTSADATHEKKENGRAGNSKKTEIHIPEDPVEMNSYTGTLYEGYSLCSVLRAYKFPGKLSQDKGKGISRWDEGSKPTVKTISCSRLDNMPGIKAVWLKGKTDKEITLSVKRKFKNITLVKSDGRKFKPDAISHYYPGRGVITEYAGKYFNLVFKDKVELILFFKDAEAGDKIIIEGIIEAVIKSQP